MDDGHNYIRIINELQRRLPENRRLIESIIAKAHEALKEIDIIQAILKELVLGTTNLSQNISSINAFAVADGKTLSKIQAHKLNRDTFDIVLDIPAQSLKAINGKNHKLSDCDLSILGPKRFSLLVFMLEHPLETIGIHNIHMIPSYEEGILANSLSKSIHLLRDVLQPATCKADYIISAKVITRPLKCEITTGFGYRMNPDFKYLVILKNISNSQDFP